MKNLYKPENEVKLSLIKSILENENIPYFVKNDHFGSLYIGLQIDLFNARMIMVDEEDYDRSKELIADFLDKIKEEPDAQKIQYSLFDKIRMVSEAFIFGWIIPGKKKINK